MEQEPENQEEGDMEGRLTLVENYLPEMPDVEAFHLGPHAAELFGSPRFELVPSADPELAAVYASYAINRDGEYGVRGYGPRVITYNHPTDLAAGLLFSTAIVGEQTVIGGETLKAEPKHRWTVKGVSGIGSLVNRPALVAEMSEEARMIRGGRKATTFIFSRSGNLQSESTLFSDPGGEAFVVTTEAGREKAVQFLGGASDRVLVFGTSDIDHRAFLAYARRELGISRLGIQGGRQMFAPFPEKGLATQLLLSVVDAPAQDVPGERLTLFSEGGILPPRGAKLIAKRHAAPVEGFPGFTLYNYDLRGVHGSF